MIDRDSLPEEYTDEGFPYISLFILFINSDTSGSKGGHDINLLDLHERGLNLCGSIKDCKDNFVYINNDLYKNIKFSDEHALNWAKNVDKYIKKETALY